MDALTFRLRCRFIRQHGVDVIHPQPIGSLVPGARRKELQAREANRAAEVQPLSRKPAKA